MQLRKVNAILSLITTVLLLYHAIFLAVWMLSGLTVFLHVGIVAWVLLGAMVLHAYISIELAISGHEGAQKRKCKEYPKLNFQTIVQRMSGVLMLLFTALHILGATGVMTPPKFIHAIVPALFFTLVLAHVAVSASKAFITLGIGSAKFIKIADIVIKILCALTLIADLTGFYLYLV